MKQYTGTAAILFVVFTLALPEFAWAFDPQYGGYEFKNDIWRCDPPSGPTLCYSASTYVGVGGNEGGPLDYGSCAVARNWITQPVMVRGVVIAGGGTISALPDKYASAYKPSDCQHTPIYVAYSGVVLPCASGGTTPWMHRSAHGISWDAGFEYMGSIGDTYEEKVGTYLLTQSTCKCPTGGTKQ